MMSTNQSIEGSEFGNINSAKQLGNIVRTFRKSQNLTLDKISDLSHLSMRFLSELERGKETAELGKVIEALNIIGLEIIIQPRGYIKEAQVDKYD